MSDTNATLAEDDEAGMTDPYGDVYDPAFMQRIIIAKIVGLLSAMGSGYIVYSMLIDVKDAADRQKKLHRTFDRLLLCLCVSNFVSSLAYFCGSW